MDKKSNKNQGVNFSNYLVTQAVDIKDLNNKKISSDLDELNKAEEKKDHKPDISRDIRNPQIKRAVSALKLTNPFKGY